MSFGEVERGFLPLLGCWFNFQIVNSLLINLHILLRYPTPKFYFLMGPHATPVGIKTRGQDDIIFKCTQIFHLFDKISGNSGSHFYSLAAHWFSIYTNLWRQCNFAKSLKFLSSINLFARSIECFTVKLLIYYWKAVKIFFCIKFN